MSFYVDISVTGLVIFICLYLFSNMKNTYMKRKIKETRSSPECLNEQVLSLTDVQQNTIKNMEERNTAMRAQNETLLQICQTMAAELKENVAFYKSYIEQKNATTDLMNPVLDQMKQLQIAIKNLQEVKPSPEVSYLIEIQQNTTKNIKEHNALLSDQNKALLQTCQTMAAEFKENVAFYKSFIEQKNATTDLMNPVLDQMKQLQIAIKNLQIDVRNISSEITEIKNMRIPQTKHGIKVTQNKLDKEMNPTTFPPHSYQISLPSSSVISFPTMSQSFPLTASSEHAFSTEGLLSSVPAPLYSAITTYQSPEKGNKNLLASSLTSTPVTHRTNLKGGLFGSAINKNAADKKDGKLNFETKDPKTVNKFEPNSFFDKSSQLKKNDSVVSDTSKDDIKEYEPRVDIIPMPDLVDVKTGEEEEEQLFCEKAKLFRYDKYNKEWKERGVGDSKLLMNRSSGKIRFLMRRDQTHKVCANHFITQDMLIIPMAYSDKAWVWSAHDFADEEMKMEKLAIRFKTIELAKKFKDMFEDALKNLPADVPKREEEKPSGKNVSESSKDMKPFSELFKPSSGSWECSVCLGWNKAYKLSCLICSSPKDEKIVEAKPAGFSLFGSLPLPFKSNASGNSAFLFGVPAATVASTTKREDSGFTFEFLNSSTSSTTTNVTATTTKPMTSTLYQQTAIEITSTTTPAVTSVRSTTSVKYGSSEFTFGSNGKYKFEFSGVKSLRSRYTSTYESEGAEEEDNLFFKPVIPLPDKVKVITGEEEETPLFSHRAKLFRIKDGEFKERGLGDVKILEHKVSGKNRLLMRREQIHKVCLNHYLTKDLKFVPKDEKSLCWVATDFSEQDPVKETFAIRFKTAEKRNLFLAGINEAQIKSFRAHLNILEKYML